MICETNQHHKTTFCSCKCPSQDSGFKYFSGVIINWDGWSM